jgi:hypothetical protein
MNRVTAKVTQEVRMLLQHNYLDTSARQQKSEHHPGRPTAGDATTGLDLSILTQGV